MKKGFERKENCIIAVLTCIIAVLLVVIFADEEKGAVAVADIVRTEMESATEDTETFESEMKEETVVQEIATVEGTQEEPNEDFGSFAQYYMDNPIDNILSEQIATATPQIAVRDLQELYKELWYEEYDGMLEHIRKYCIYEEEQENWSRFYTEAESGYDELEPLIKNLMLETFEVPSDSPEKATWGWGSGTASRLAMQEGMYYRNLCMLLVPVINNLEEKYEFVTVEEIMERVDEITGGETIVEVIVSSEVEEARMAYGEALWEVLQRGILPDGRQLDWVAESSAKQNSFAISDIDRDGKEELIIRWENAAVAWMMEAVYGYQDGVLYQELTHWPLITYYDNDMVEVRHYRGQPGAETLWPYDMYCYDEEKDVYQYVATALSWDKAILEMNEDDYMFPDELDLDGDGVLYYILTDFSVWPFDVNCLVDKAEYEKWRNSYMDGAKEMNINYQSIIDQNISRLGYPKPYVFVPEPKG